VNKFFQNPNLILKKYLNIRDNSKEDEKYKEEILKNKTTIEEGYEKVELLFEQLIGETNPQFKDIIEKKIARFRKEIESLEKRNSEIKNIIINHKQIITNTKAFEGYIEEFK